MTEGKEGGISSGKFDLDPGDATGFYERGCRRLEKGEEHSAIEDFNSALGIDKKFAEAYVKRGRCLQGPRLPWPCPRRRQDWTALGSCDSGGTLGEGKIYGAIKEYGLATDSFTECVQLDPGCAEAYKLRAVSLWNLTGEIDRPIEDLKKAIELVPDQQGAYMSMGVLLSTAVNPAMTSDHRWLAIEYFDSAISLEPQSANAHYFRGSALMKLGEAERAIADMDKALELGGGNIDPWMLYRDRALSYFHRKDFAQAMADFDSAIESNPRDTISLNNRGSVHRVMGDYEAAVRDYTRAIDLLTYSDPNLDLPTVYINRAMCNRAMSNRAAGVGAHMLDRALLDLDRALSINPNRAEAYLERAKVHLEKGEIERYTEDMEKADALFSSAAEGLVGVSHDFSADDTIVFLGMDSGNTTEESLPNTTKAAIRNL